MPLDMSKCIKQSHKHRRIVKKVNTVIKLIPWETHTRCTFNDVHPSIAKIASTHSVNVLSTLLIGSVPLS